MRKCLCDEVLERFVKEKRFAMGTKEEEDSIKDGPCQNILICENMDNFMGGDMWHLMASKMKAHK